MNKKILLSTPLPQPIPTHVLFRLDGQLYGIPLSQVAGVSLTDRAPVQFPYVDSIQRFDLRALLHLSGRETGQETGLIILSGRQAGFPVDSIEDVFTAAPECISRAGTIEWGRQTVTLLDIGTLLSRDTDAEESFSHAEAA